MIIPVVVLAVKVKYISLNSVSFDVIHSETIGVILHLV